jgi:hypothetical protein
MIFSRYVALGHDVLLHLLQDNILQAAKFRTRLWARSVKLDEPPCVATTIR